ncbi:MAG: hypothetical protein HXO47_06885 [Prevotella sp.]|uniref:Uncharacterized protein n=1 Tax=Prevotella vespertina TaxID=2608404 RepID=A0A7C9LQG3_9BACT|nr:MULTISPECIES: hypothetical protein [Prevotella]MBF1626854.1 hypothetical protein [Prevotella sp.]MBF1638539.1 hypothetical protein [Prevotella sp.]MUL28518.1 hypothetical protein [Prevotella vespertina]
MTTEHHHQHHHKSHSNSRIGRHTTISSKGAQRRHKINQVLKFVATIAAICLLYLVWWIYNN